MTAPVVVDRVDIVVPVYGQPAQTRRCLESVLASTGAVPFRLLVVDDASPDEATTGYLDTQAANGRIELLRNSANLGFVGSVNRGIAHSRSDVVLLNSDTEVANDWLDRLRRCAHSAVDVGTATPLSNNATICSYPYEGWTGGVPGTLGLAALDRLVALANRGRYVDLPTAVGFCMYIRRDCVDEIGIFDAERFGRGYGEENDFCLRAAARGWRHLLAGDTFVFHEGGASFAAERAERVDQALRTLLELHPDYLERIGDFYRRDPVAPLREAIDDARARLVEPEPACVALERHVRSIR